MTEITVEDRYLGDGVYASFDGYHIVLDLRGQDNTTRIALEAGVMTKLIRFSNDIETDLAVEAAVKLRQEAQTVADDWDREMLGDDAIILEDHDIGNK